MANKKDASTAPAANGNGKWNVPTGRRTDEWSEALVLVGESQDRGAFTRFFRHFAPLIKAFALSGSSLSASHADELVQEVMLKVWQKAGGFNPEKAAASTWVYTIARNCRTDMFRESAEQYNPQTWESKFNDQHGKENGHVYITCSSGNR